MATNDKVFDLLRRDIPGRNQIGRNKKKPIQPPNMGTRPPGGRDPSDDPYLGPGDQVGPQETGAQQGGPGFGSAAAHHAGSGAYTDYPITNMNDAYDYFQNVSNWHPYYQQFDSFYDWWQDELSQEPGDYGSTWNSYSGSQGQQTGGGATGGSGDIGTGNMFTGGMYGPGEEGTITNPFGQGWGPGGQYETTEPGTGWAVDDSMAVDDDCFAAWQQSGAADSYADFTAAMCSG